MGVDDDDRSPFFGGSTKDGFNMNSKIMISAISSLGFVVFLVILLHIYARCMIRRQSRRRRIALQNLQLSFQNSAAQQPKTGLEPAVIASLPIFAFKKLSEGTDDCSVCLSLLETDEMVRMLPNCHHTFHAECIDMWLESHSTCPICRTEAQPATDIASSLQEPTAPPIDGSHIPAEGIITSGCDDGAGGGGVQLAPPTAKIGGSGSRMSSFRRIMNRERSLLRVQSCGQDDLLDLERQH